MLLRLQKGKLEKVFGEYPAGFKNPKTCNKIPKWDFFMPVSRYGDGGTESGFRWCDVGKQRLKSVSGLAVGAIKREIVRGL